MAEFRLGTRGTVKTLLSEAFHLRNDIAEAVMNNQFEDALRMIDELAGLVQEARTAIIETRDELDGKLNPTDAKAQLRKAMRAKEKAEKVIAALKPQVDAERGIAEVVAPESVPENVERVN
jgi:ABC-type transporter Mla subunit MlaD